MAHHHDNMATKLETGYLFNGEDLRVRTVASEEDLCRLSYEVATAVTPASVDSGVVTGAFQSFLKSLYSRTGPDTVAFVDRYAASIGQLLDIHVLWSHDIQLLHDAPEMREVDTEHIKLAKRLDPVLALDTFVKIVDRRRYGSAERFAIDLAEKWQRGGVGRVLTCARLERPQTHS